MLIFNFHHVEPEPLKHPSRKHITISPLGLSRFIRTLRLLGLSIVSLRDVLEQTPGIGPEQARQVVLTFDDGYVNNLTHAMPVLEAERCPATIFALPGRFGGTNEWDQGELPEAERDSLMTLAQMQRMAASPWVTFGSHGLEHRRFTQLPAGELEAEIYESHALLKAALGEAYLPVLAYPWGDHSSSVLARMEDSPYAYAFTTEKGFWTAESHPYAIPRYSAYWRDGQPLVFLLKLLRNGLLKT